MSTTMTKPNFSRNTQGARTTWNPPTPKMVEFAVQLVTDIGQIDRELGLQLWNDLAAEQAAGKFDYARCHRAIDQLKVQRASVQEARRTALAAEVAQERSERKAEAREVNRPRPEVPEGRYAVDTDEGHVAFYHVEVSKTGFITVRLYKSDQTTPLPWKTARTVLRKIEEAGPLAASVRFGQEWHVCGVCGLALTNPKSRELGIGPVCITRL
jgi:hypothetical protein